MQGEECCPGGEAGAGRGHGDSCVGSLRGHPAEMPPPTVGRRFQAPTGWPSEPTSFAPTPPPTTLCPADPSTPAQPKCTMDTQYVPRALPIPPALGLGKRWTVLTILAVRLPGLHHLTLPSGSSSHTPLLPFQHAFLPGSLPDGRYFPSEYHCLWLLLPPASTDRSANTPGLQPSTCFLETGGCLRCHVCNMRAGPMSTNVVTKAK